MRIGWRTDNPPDGRDAYLVQYECGDMDVAWWSDASRIFPEEKTDWHWVGTSQYQTVVAWMLLPEPYREEQG